MRALSKLYHPAGPATRSSPKISHVACASMDAPKGQRLQALASSLSQGLSHEHHARSGAISTSSLAWRRASSTDASDRSRFDSVEVVKKEVQEANKRHTIQVGWDRHVLMDLPGRFLNHSCDPNVGVGREINAGGSYDFVARRDIGDGDELRFDYETSEYEVGGFDECSCGASTCRGVILGYKHNKDAIDKLYGNEIAGYLLTAKER
ncbi:hypothetical protein THAOC_34622 [Thalassiosira oceanica]|uniref:Post-SET domain-containing protein n=1 Tax=Thalassiosira oceanica TaxID=159749 RepID=K0R385_THAOC|nr:hypothetical protein THAOC_34622 [Thalassiosira oceanica]|eukprot:EJK46695.1 hypothetical protein THAOC_34622 [Thalassiosira oceanica]